MNIATTEPSLRQLEAPDIPEISGAKGALELIEHMTNTISRPPLFH